MKLTLTRDVDEFAIRTRDLFESRAIECNLIASVCAGVRAGQYARAPPLFAYGTEKDDVVFAALRTPPWDMLATGIDPESAGELVRLWLAADPSLPGVGGVPGAARPIADAWKDTTGGTVSTRVEAAVYLLEQVCDPPHPVEGRLRRALAEERSLLVEWMKVFGRETHAYPEDRAAQTVDARFADEGLWVWDHDGPVSLVGTSVPVGRVVRIGPVYTVPSRRRRGYAAAAVSAVSRYALDHGADYCMLFADLRNPTSNKIYVEVGFRRVGERVEYEFERA